MLLFFFRLYVLLTQQPPCPPGAAADSPACPHNDSNHPISHWGTQKHCRVGLVSMYSAFDQFRMRKYCQNLNSENVMFAKVWLNLPAEKLLMNK